MYRKTYSEQYQAVLFRAAAETYDVASAVLNDCTDPAEFTGRTYDWARDKAKFYAEKAQELKELALSQTAVNGQPRKYNAAQARYSEAVDRHLRLRAEYTAAANELALDESFKD